VRLQNLAWLTLHPWMQPSGIAGRSNLWKWEGGMFQRRRCLAYNRGMWKPSDFASFAHTTLIASVGPTLSDVRERPSTSSRSRTIFMKLRGRHGGRRERGDGQHGHGERRRRRRRAHPNQHVDRSGRPHGRDALALAEDELHDGGDAQAAVAAHPHEGAETESVHRQSSEPVTRRAARLRRGSPTDRGIERLHCSL
jgi:hypothetical protein